MIGGNDSGVNNTPKILCASREETTTASISARDAPHQSYQYRAALFLLSIGSPYLARPLDDAVSGMLARLCAAKM